MPASQLSQLKSALTSAGLNRKTTSKKDRKTFKKGGARETDRAKTLAKLEGIRKSLNKFDELETKTKYDVGGRHIKGVIGKPSASKQAGLDQRRKTLLPEHQLRGHRGTFRDRRFGEADPTMSVEDRMLERYTRERQRGQGRKGLFNLEDDTADPFDDFEDGTALGGLTHGGRNVMELQGDDFEMQGLGSDEEEIQPRRMDPGPRRALEEEPDRPKTKAEVMSEVIAKSKSYKLERQQQKEEDEDLRNALDEDIDGLRELLQEKPEAEAGPSRRPATQETADVDYDQVVRSLAYDARSKPKNRTKTEEEVALEEADALNAAEAKRLKRMRGEESDEEGTKRRGEGDDLEDDFVEDDLLGPGLTREDIEGMDLPELPEGEDDGEEAEEEEEDDEDEDESEDPSSMEDSDDEPHPDLEPTALVTSKGSKKRSKHIEIPFTFPCPASVDELEDIMMDLDDSALPIVVQRIRTCHHPSLAESNKAKLQGFFGVLVDYILVLASRSTLAAVSPLVPHVVALLKLNPTTAAHYFVAKLVLMQKNLVSGLARGNDARTWPGAAELVLLRIIGLVWSTSDFSHPVVAPAMLLMGQYLAQARVRSLSDLASGLFLCSLVAQYESFSKRLVPETLGFVLGAVQTLFSLRKGTKTLGVDNLSMTNPNIPPLTADFASSLSAKDGDEGAKASLAGTALRVVSSLAELHASSPAFIEMYEPLQSTLQACRINKLSPDLQPLHGKTLASLSRMVNLSRSTRQPLSLQAHKPIPIASFAPKFEDDFAPGRHYDPDVDRNAAKKMRTLYKKERSGAIRELRKDNRFLAGEKSREQSEKDRAYNAKMRKVEGAITSERAEEKQMEREKARQKRRK